MSNTTNTDDSMNEFLDSSDGINNHINFKEQERFPKIIATSGSVQFSPTDSETSIDTPRSFTEVDASIETSPSNELSIAESILAGNSYINQKKRKISTEKGNVPKKRCNLKKRGLSKDFDEIDETKPSIETLEEQISKLKKEIERVQEEEAEYLSKVKKDPNVEEKKFEFNYWDCYLCSDCLPLKMLAGAEGLVDHCKEMDEHKDIRPLWTFNQCEVKMNDLKKSYKLGVLVREKEREYFEYKKFIEKFNNVGLLYSTFHSKHDLGLDDGKQNKGEEPKLKLKIGKGANGIFSVLS